MAFVERDDANYARFAGPQLAGFPPRRQQLGRRI
jgi:hypothetical protein